jgi:hypothetical protein
MLSNNELPDPPALHNMTHIVFRHILAAFAGLVLFLATGCSAEGQEAADQEDWIALFNGRDLTGWIPKITGYEVGENFGNTFRVEDGLLQVRYDAYDQFDSRFGHLFYEEPFSYYRLVVEYRFVGDQVAGGPNWAFRNSGIMVHGQPAETMGRDQDFPISIEVQLLGGDGTSPRPNANLCSPGTHVVMDGELVTQHCVTANAETYHGDQWVQVEALVLGDSLIQHILEDRVVLEYTMPQIGGGNVSNFDPAVKQDGHMLTGGSISLQSESHPIDFRKVELLNLKGCMDQEALNYRSHFVAHDAAQCRY